MFVFSCDVDSVLGFVALCGSWLLLPTFSEEPVAFAFTVEVTVHLWALRLIPGAHGSIVG